MVNLGHTLKTLRSRDGLTQEQLAKKLGLVRGTICQYENDLRMPSYDVLIEMARIFNVTTDYLLGNERKDKLDVSDLSPGDVDILYSIIKVMRRNK